jgi:hypothetical protein
VLGRGCGSLQVTRDAIQALEHAPAGRQRGIDADSVLEGIDRVRHIVRRREAMSPLLIQPAEPRTLQLQTIQSCERSLTQVQATLIDGGEIKNVAALCERCLQYRDRAQSLAMAPPPGQLANSSQLHGTVIGLQLRALRFHRHPLASWPKVRRQHPGTCREREVLP